MKPLFCLAVRFYIGFVLYINHMYTFVFALCFLPLFLYFTRVGLKQFCTTVIVQTLSKLFKSGGIKALLCPEKTLGSTLVHFIIKI